MLGDPLCLPWLAQGQPLTTWRWLPGRPEGTWVWFRAGSLQLKTDGVLCMTAATKCHGSSGKPTCVCQGKEMAIGMWDLLEIIRLSQCEPRPLQLKGSLATFWQIHGRCPLLPSGGGLWLQTAFDT